MAVYNASGGIIFTITDETGALGGEKVPSGAESIIGSGADEPSGLISSKTSDKEAASGASSNRAANMLISKALSPVNQATGGLATPAFSLVRSIAKGAKGAAIAAPIIGLVFAGYALAEKLVKDAQTRKEETKTAARAERRTGMASYDKRNK